MNLKSFLIGIACLGLVVVGTAMLRARTNAPFARPMSVSPLGDTIPDVTLLTPDGKQEPLKNRIRNRPAALYIYSAAECSSCAGFALEFDILKREIPNVVPLLIGTGGARSAFREYFERAQVVDNALIDESSTLLKGLRVHHGPLVLLIDSNGRIVFVDSRSTSQASQYPLGRVLHDLKAPLAIDVASRGSTK